MVIILAILLAALSTSATPSAWLAVTPSQLHAAPHSFDGQHVGVTGKVENLQLKTSERGNDYETFNLCDKACVRVFTWGHPKLTQGQSETVHGTFAAVKHVGSSTFYNDIEADETWRTQCC